MSDKVEITQEEYESLQSAQKALKEQVTQKLESEAIDIENREYQDFLAKALRETYFDDDGKFYAMRFVDDLVKNIPENSIASPQSSKGGDDIYWYSEEKGIFESFGIPRVEKMLQDILGEECTATKQNEVIKQLMVKTYVHRDDFFINYPEVIVFQNGVFNLVTDSFESHSPQWRALSNIPHDYNPDSKAPEIVKTLVQIADQDISALQEWLGYQFYRDYPIHKAGLFIGPGSNGKSQIGTLIKMMLGKGNCTAISLYDITSDKYATFNLFRKHANIAPDVGAKELKDTGRFKAITGDDRIRCQAKYGQPFEFDNYAKLNMSCNNVPPSPDNSDAFFRRFQSFKFRNKFVEQREFDANPELKDDPTYFLKVDKIMEKVGTKEEMEGIIVWALKGLKRLLKKGEFSNSLTTQEMREYYTMMSNPLLAFVSNHIEEDAESYVPVDLLYNAYVQWCRKKGHVSLSKNIFGQKLIGEIQFTKGRPTINGSRINVYNGIKLYNLPESVIAVIDVRGGLTSNQNLPAILRRSRNSPDSPDSPDTYPNVEEQENDSELIELARYHIKNQGGKCKTEDLVMHMSDNGYEFSDFRTLKRYTLIFKISNGHIETLDGGWDD